jgi:hypothetical protein
VSRKSFLGWVFDLLFVCMKLFYIFMNDQIRVCDTIIKYLFSIYYASNNTLSFAYLANLASVNIEETVNLFNHVY